MVMLPTFGIGKAVPITGVPETPATVNPDTVKVFPSTSVSLVSTEEPVKVVPCDPVAMSSAAKGASFTGMIVIVKFAVLLPPFPSLIV